MSRCDGAGGEVSRGRGEEMLRRFYGYRRFRAGQWEVIDCVLKGRDAVVIMPTGGGKSMCYQMPALLTDGVVVVVSPLISLMEDQTASLIANGIPAAALHSGHTEADNRRAIDAAVGGMMKVLYVSPERLLEDMDQWMTRLNITLFAIDEAHCISQWGHDFRPVYTQLRGIREHFSDVPVMALTATADRDTRTDIVAQLGLRDPLIWLGSFNRPNLSLKVVQGASASERVAAVAEMVSRYPNDSGIVYTLSRDGADKMCKALTGRRIRAVAYHAGMGAAERARAQKAFSDGDVQVVCATIAFGMGIDKSNIRWVIHNNLPGSIENYYQEIGRAGRDGMPAETLLFYSLQDLILRRKFVEDSGRPDVTAEKLERMRQYAEATVCRRRVLLSYFGETMACDCGNCDVCLDPPVRFDGTELVQKAGSALIRAGGGVGAMMLVDILRGSARAELVRKCYDRIRTYGAGRDLSAAQWNNYILQMVQLGLLEVSLAEGRSLSVTPFGMEVVMGRRRIELAMYRPAPAAAGRKRKAVQPEVAAPDRTLFDALKTLRRRLAEESGLAPYYIFSDRSLDDMARRRPRTFDRLLDVYGVGEAKARRWGRRFIDEIIKYERENGR